MVADVASAIVAVALDQRDNGTSISELLHNRVRDLQQASDHLKADSDRKRSDLEMLQRRTGNMKMDLAVIPRYGDERSQKSIAAFEEKITEQEKKIAAAEKSFIGVNNCYRNSLDAYMRAEQWLKEREQSSRDGLKNVKDVRPASLDTNLKKLGVETEITNVQQELSELGLPPPPDSEIREAAEKWVSATAAKAPEWFTARLMPSGECRIDAARVDGISLLTAIAPERATELIAASLRHSLRGRSGSPVPKLERDSQTAKLQERLLTLLHMEETIVIRNLLAGRHFHHRPGVAPEILLGVAVADKIH